MHIEGWFRAYFCLLSEVLQEIIDFAGDGASRRYFVRWQGRPAEDDAWITEGRLGTPTTGPARAAARLTR